MQDRVPSGRMRLRLRLRHGLVQLRVLRRRAEPSAGVLSLGNKIDVSVTGIPLGQVAAQFDRLLARDVLVPAARVRQKVRLRLKRVSVSAAIKALGLRIQKRVRARPSIRRASR
jgi:hypothetical protein